MPAVRLTFSCISSFSLSFVFTLLAKLFSLFSNSFSSINSSNKVTCLSRECKMIIINPPVGNCSHVGCGKQVLFTAQNANHDDNGGGDEFEV